MLETRTVDKKLGTYTFQVTKQTINERKTELSNYDGPNNQTKTIGFFKYRKMTISDFNTTKSHTVHAQ